MTLAAVAGICKQPGALNVEYNSMLGLLGDILVMNPRPTRDPNRLPEPVSCDGDGPDARRDHWPGVLLSLDILFVCALSSFHS